MVDVVFLLLVFFMLAARFGQDAALPIAAGFSAQGYSGPPRLVDVGPQALLLNGVPVAEADLATALGGLVESPDDVVVLRPRDGATTERVVAVVETLRAAGLTMLAVVE